VDEGKDGARQVHGNTIGHGDEGPRNGAEGARRGRARPGKRPPDAEVQARGRELLAATIAGEPLSSAAAKLGIPLKTAKRALARAKEALRTEVQQDPMRARLEALERVRLVIDAARQAKRFDDALKGERLLAALLERPPKAPPPPPPTFDGAGGVEVAGVEVVALLEDVVRIAESDGAVLLGREQIVIRLARRLVAAVAPPPARVAVSVLDGVDMSPVSVDAAPVHEDVHADGNVHVDEDAPEVDEVVDPRQPSLPFAPEDSAPKPAPAPPVEGRMGWSEWCGHPVEGDS
jgi:hypothetical protein